MATPESNDGASRKRTPDGRREPSGLSLVGVGFEFGGAIIALTLGGLWLDRRWGTGPWLMLIGLVIGFVGGVYNLWKIGKRFF